MLKYNIIETVKTKMGNNISLIGSTSPITNHTSLIIGVFHGDEPQGKFLIEEFLKNNKYPPLEGGSKSLISGRGQAILASHKYTTSAQNNAKILRNNLTKPEIILWNYLKCKQLNGLKFRRQQPIGKYIVDFMCCNPKLVIELDGGQHNTDKNIAD